MDIVQKLDELNPSATDTPTKAFALLRRVGEDERRQLTRDEVDAVFRLLPELKKNHVPRHTLDGLEDAANKIRSEKAE